MTSTPPQSLPQPGDLLVGKYRIERVLGQGGMGIVYAAHHELLAQRVAVKLLTAQDAKREAAGRFLQEARAAARIQHDNIARVSDVGTLENGTPYMVMEYLEGHDLAAIVERGGALSATVAVDYVLQALEAIAQAHALGIVHRDLKPANLFLAQRLDGSSVVKVLDFGISKSVTPLEGAAQTSTQAILGSPYYMSPEQLRSSKNVDQRTDIWSIGVILFELLSGTLPFNSETLGGLFATILEDGAPPLSSRCEGTPVLFDQIVARCLARKPEDRFGSAVELAVALAPFASPAGALSAERIQLHTLPPNRVTPARLSAIPTTASTGHTTGKGRTAATWQTSGTTGATVAPKSRSIVPLLLGVTVLAAGIGIAAWRLSARVPLPLPSATSATATLAAPAESAHNAIDDPKPSASSSESPPPPSAAASASSNPVSSPAVSAAARRPGPHSIPAPQHTSTPAYDPKQDSRL